MATVAAEDPPAGLFDPERPPPEMLLTVFLSCRHCYRQLELTVAGEWDLAGVRHDCDGIPGFEVARG